MLGRDGDFYTDIFISRNKIVRHKVHIRLVEIVQNRGSYMLDFRLVERLLLHFLPDGSYCSVRVSVLLLARNFRGRNGADGFGDVRAVLHQCHPVPLYHELRQYDGLRVQGQLKLVFSRVLTCTE